MHRLARPSLLDNALRTVEKAGPFVDRFNFVYYKCSATGNREKIDLNRVL